MTDVAVVTGGTRGIGRAIAERLAAEGWAVYAVGRSAPPPVHNAGPGEVVFVPGDVRHAHTIRWAMERARASGTLRLLVNAAGIVRPGQFMEVEPASWAEQFNVNTIGAISASSLFLQALGHHAREPFRRLDPGTLAERAKRPAIVFVASTSGQRPSPGWAAYGASKAALINFGQSLAAEWREVNVITVSPGRTATALRRAMAPLEDQSTIQQPEDVAAFLWGLMVEAERQDDRSFTGSPLVCSKVYA